MCYRALKDIKQTKYLIMQGTGQEAMQGALCLLSDSKHEVAEMH